MASLLLYNMKDSRFIQFIIGLSAIILLLSFLVLPGDFTEDKLRMFIAGSARASAVLFSLAFGISSFYYFTKDRISKSILSYRPMIGLAFAVVHTAHLIYLVILQKQFHPVFDLAAGSALLGGGMAYVFMYAMAATTFPALKKKLSIRIWQGLHLVGGWWIWLIFFRSYFKNILRGGDAYVMFALLGTVLLLRISRRIHRWYMRQTVTPPGYSG